MVGDLESSRTLSDVYEEKINPKNHLQYLYDGKWLNIRVESATFKVKGPKGLESVVMPLYYTEHGPVVSFDKEHNRAYSVKLPNFNGVNYATGLYRIMKSQNLPEFKAAVAQQLMPRWNLLYSDSENIYWVHNGNVARRADRVRLEQTGSGVDQGDGMGTIPSVR